MALNISSSKAMVDEIVRNVKDYSVLVGDEKPVKKIEGLTCTPGLNMTSESNALCGRVKDLEGGLFKLLVMGKFKNGKSTFINALLGKMMMAAKTTATTAVIAMVEFGTNERTVQVYENGSSQPRTISLERFTQEFALTEKDQEIIEKGGDVDRFAHIDYAVMQSSNELFEDGVRLIDSPGLEENHARTKTTNNFVPKANAIIFTLNAPSLFSAAERKYINENFVGRGLRNVFFVVNRIDNLNDPDALEKNVKPAVRAHLEGVFTDENGCFDEELFNKRVFYTTAYGALCVRTGEPYTTLVGRKAVPVPITIEETGMLEFEQALTEFLNSDERLVATFQSTLTNMANVYQSAAKKIASEKKARALPLEELEKNAVEVQAALNDLRKQAEDMRKCIRATGSLVSGKIYNSMLNFAQNDIPREFASAVENEKVDFGFAGMMKMAGTMVKGTITRKDNSAELNKILKPISDKVNNYIKDQMKDWKATVPTLIDQDLCDMEAELGESVAEFDMGLDRAVDLFANGNASKVYDSRQKGNALQTILALSNWDVSLAVEGMASGGMKWGDFFKRVAWQFGLDAAVAAFLGAVYLVPALIIEVFSMSYRGGQMGRDMMKKIGSVAFNNLANKIRSEEMTIKANIEATFVENGDTICATALKLITEKEAALKKILEDKRRNETNAATEDIREDQILSAMRNRFNNVYSVLYGRDASDADLVKLARTEDSAK